MFHAIERENFEQGRWAEKSLGCKCCFHQPGATGLEIAWAE